MELMTTPPWNSVPHHPLETCDNGSIERDSSPGTIVIFWSEPWMLDQRLSCDSITPLGSPVVPDV
jgi:hypothetical protein